MLQQPEGSRSFLRLPEFAEFSRSEQEEVGLKNPQTPPQRWTKGQLAETEAGQGRGALAELELRRPVPAQ